MTENATQPIDDIVRFTALQEEAAKIYRCLPEPFNSHRLLSGLVFGSLLIGKNSLVEQGSIRIPVSSLRNELIDLAARALGLAAIWHGSPAQPIPYRDMELDARDTFEAKNKDYGDSYKTYGSVGVLIRMRDKLMRVQQLTRAEARVKSESISDTLLDTYNYCLMAVMLIDQGK